VRAALRRGRRHVAPDVYQAWFEANRLLGGDLAKLRQMASELEGGPTISIVTPVYNTEPDQLRACIQSMLDQIYPNWQLCLFDDASTSTATSQALADMAARDERIRVATGAAQSGIAAASNAAAQLATGAWIGFLDHDDTLEPDALLWVANAIAAAPDMDVVYTDEDKLDLAGRHCDPYFKPDWSPEHLRSVMYTLHLSVYRRSLFDSLGGLRPEYDGAQDYDLALRATRQSNRVGHVPRVLYHWRMAAGSASAAVDAKPEALENARRALQADIQASEHGGTAEPGLLPGIWRAKYAIRNRPRVSIVIPTADRTYEDDAGNNARLLLRCVRQLYEVTDYREFDVVIVDDGTLSDESREGLRDLPHRLVSFQPDRPFNFPRKANFCFQQVEHEPVVLLTDDVEPVSREWLEALLEFGQQSEIGAVGARLLYPDGKLQHVGTVLGINGSIGHIYHRFPGDTVGYYGFPRLIRNYSAVTGACFMTRKSVIDKLGGFDEQLAIDFNDVDYCLRARQLGLRVVYTPYATLIHRESATLPRTSQNPKEVALFMERWGALLRADPHYNPNLALDTVDFSGFRARE
jgi:GT2 family glycosyltransferase